MTTIPHNSAYLNFTRLNSQTASMAHKEYEKITLDLSSGGLVEDYSDVLNVKAFVGNEIELSSHRSYHIADDHSLLRMTSMSTELVKLHDVATNLKREISATISNSWITLTNLIEVAKNAQRNIYNALNTSFNDQYLFSGTSTITQSVDSVDDSSVTAAGAVTYNYYKGNDEPIVFKASKDTNIMVDVNGGNDGIAELIYAVNLCIYSSGSASDPVVQERLARATDLCNSACEKILDANTSLQVQMKSVKDISDTLKVKEQSLETSIQAIGYKTPVDALKQYMDARTSLEIAQTVITKNDYIRSLIDQL